MRSPVLAAALLVAIGGAEGETATYVVDPTHAAVTYAIGHFGTSTSRGRFKVKGGTVQLDRAAGTGKVEVTIDTAAVDSGVAALDRRLAGKEFLDAADFPTARFVADSLAFDGDQVSAVSGALTLRGQTRPVALKALRFNCYTHPMLRREVCGGDFEATIRRSQWGIGSGLDRGVADDVQLVIQVEAIRQ